MSDDVAAVLKRLKCVRGIGHDKYVPVRCDTTDRKHPECVLAALATENYAVVRLPEGVAVAHGARLVALQRMSWLRNLYAIEDAP